MAELNSHKDRALKRADTASKEITETRHASEAEKTKKLRALRLAKEAADANDKPK